MKPRKPDRHAMTGTTVPQPVRAYQLAQEHLPNGKDKDYIMRLLDTKKRNAEKKQPAKDRRVRVRRLLRAGGEIPKDKKDWRVEADKWFARFIRMRDTYPDSDGHRQGACVTCYRPKWLHELQCGHWIRRENWGTRFDERNCHAQCAYCNGFRGGMEQEHEEQIIKRYGQEVRNKLLLFKKVKQRQPSAQAFKAIAEKYEAKVNEMGGWLDKE